MNKKQKIKTIVLQNKRNKLINRYYKSTIKTLFKAFLLKVKNIQEKKVFYKHNISMLNIISTYYSMIDKAVKKNVISINNAAKKKSKIFNHI